jgi:site-specific recombinase XerC
MSEEVSDHIDADAGIGGIAAAGVPQLMRGDRVLQPGPARCRCEQFPDRVRAGLENPVTPHQLRHACGSNAADAGVGIDVVADLLGHANISSSQVYVHPGASRLRAAVDAVPSPREREEGSR